MRNGLVLLCVLLLSMLTIIVHTQSPDNLPFHPRYPPSHQWDIACQRVNYNNSYIDIDYFPSSYTIVLSRRRVTNSNLLNVTTSVNNITTFHNVKWKGVDMYFETCSIPVDSDELVLVTLYWNTIQETITRITLDSTSTEFRNRSLCYDNFNYMFYRQHVRKQAYLTAVILHSMFVVALILLFSIQLSAAKGRLMKYRYFPSVISSVCAILSFLTGMVMDYTAKYSYSARYIEDGLPNSFEIVRIVCIHVTFTIGLGAYLFKMLRYQQVKLTKKTFFKPTIAARLANSRLFQIALSKHTFNIVFVLSVITVNAISVGCSLIGIKVSLHSIDPKKYRKTVGAQILFLILLVNIIYVVDIILNFGTVLSKGLVYFLTTDDPLLYRREGFIVMSGLIGYFVTVVYDRTKNPTADIWMSTLFSDIFIQWAYLTAFIVAGSIPITMVQIKRFLTKDRSAKKRNTEQAFRVEELLRDDVFYNLFGDYCLGELSTENLMVWKELDTMKEQEYISYEALQQINEKYIDKNAALQVNISSKTLIQIEKLLKQTHVLLFDFNDIRMLYNDVIGNICDSFSRFTKTPPYKRYLEVNQLMQHEFYIEMEE
jgi:hypothetical protein